MRTCYVCVRKCREGERGYSQIVRKAARKWWTNVEKKIDRIWNYFEWNRKRWSNWSGVWGGFGMGNVYLFLLICQICSMLHLSHPIYHTYHFPPFMYDILEIQPQKVVTCDYPIQKHVTKICSFSPHLLSSSNSLHQNNIHNPSLH